MDAELRDALHQLQGSWLPRPQAEATRLVEQLESRYSVRLPKDFRTYLVEASGRTGWCTDIGWYPIEGIRSLTQVLEGLPEVATGDEAPQLNREVETEADHYLVFADYLDWCGYGYAICCSDSARRGHVAMVHPSPGRFICRSFTTFVRLAALDSDRLHSTAGDHYTDIP